MAYKVIFNSSFPDKTVQSNYYNSINLTGQFTLQALSAFAENMGEGYKGNLEDCKGKELKVTFQGDNNAYTKKLYLDAEDREWYWFEQVGNNTPTKTKFNRITDAPYDIDSAGQKQVYLNSTTDSVKGYWGAIRALLRLLRQSVLSFTCGVGRTGRRFFAISALD